MTIKVSKESLELSSQELNFLQVNLGVSEFWRNLETNLICRDCGTSEDEDFKVEYQLTGTTLNLQIERNSFFGFKRAINSIRRELINDNLLSGTILAQPSFKTRGVIEGFYGKPWTMDERIDMIRFIALHDFNLYILAPKDDPWQRFNWRQPFNDFQLKELTALKNHADEFGINLCVCVSPGLSINYSDKNDIAALTGRITQLSELGINQFGLLLDDIPSQLMHESDLQIFSSIEMAHSYLANAVNSHIKSIDPDGSLIFCPLQYHGRGTEDYISSLGKNLSNDVYIFWTGRQICSEYLDVADAIVFNENTNRMPFYWDNYPVNDVAMVHQLHVGPIANRESHLYKYAAGYASNPMDRPEASKFALATIGSYLNDPENYESNSSWTQFLNEHFSNSTERKSLEYFLRACFESCLSVDPAPDFNSWLFLFSFAWHSRQIDTSIELLESQSRLILDSHAIISAPTFSNQKLQLEVGRWLNKFQNVGASLRNLAELLNQVETKAEGQLIANNDLATGINEIRDFLAQDPTRIFGDGLDMMLGELAAELAVARN